MYGGGGQDNKGGPLYTDGLRAKASIIPRAGERELLLLLHTSSRHIVVQTLCESASDRA